METRIVVPECTLEYKWITSASEIQKRGALTDIAQPVKTKKAHITIEIEGA